jgi:hypothetical protein
MNMRKTFFGCLVLMMFLSMVQSVYAARFGVKFGTQRLDSDSESFHPKVGLFYSIRLGKNISLQPELYLSNFTYDYAGINFEGTETARKQVRFYDNLRYIEVPVLLKYTVPLSGDIKPIILVGGYTAFRISEKIPDYDMLYENKDWWDFYNTPLVREYPNMDAGLVLGIGIEHGSKKTRLSFDVRFNIGLTNLAKVYSSEKVENSYGEYILPYDYSQRNHSLSFTVGLSF